MGLDFDNQEGRTNYLNERLDNLLSGINESYGQVLLDELMTRLQRTIVDFNDEITSVMDELKLSSNRRNQIIHDLMEGKESESNQQNVGEEDHSKSDAPEMSEWEKRLEGK